MRRRYCLSVVTSTRFLLSISTVACATASGGVAGVADDGECTAENCTAAEADSVTTMHIITTDTDTVDTQNGYSGETDREGRPHGLGVLQADLLSYTGQFSHGAFHGHGTARWAGNGTYVGQFDRGLPNGRGRHRTDGGTVYWGGWLGGTRHGLGIVTAPDGSMTFGEWDGGEMLGRGVTLDSSPLLEGEATVQHVTDKIDDAIGAKKRRGQGICTFENGDAFAGQWVAELAAPRQIQGGENKKPVENINQDVSNKRRPNENKGSCVWESDPGQPWASKSTVSFVGSGFYKYANGDYYAGEFKNMARNGKGTYVGVDGGKYAGSWKAGQYHGMGTLLLPGGKGIQSGVWDHNHFRGDVNEVPQVNVL
eukprot:m.465476 g.465476  ORF g.465476 m.465476 type:complete len:367 (+) comp24274_c0_seq1:220-1320(+)